MGKLFLDCLLHHTVAFNIKDDLYRIEEKRKAGFSLFPQLPNRLSEEFLSGVLGGILNRY